MAEPLLPPARHETQDVSFRFLLAGFAGVLLGVLFCAFLTMWIYPSAVADRRIGAPLPRYPEPHLQSNPQAELQIFLAREKQRLDTAGWVDRSHGIVHIPIDDVMRKIAARGIPDWPSRQEAGR